MDKFEDLPRSLHEHFLALSSLAFQGFVNEEVIFHSLSPSLLHFGFLDAVSALYGGGGVSYNFLHLTLQEFFAAYHISCLDNEGQLEMFKQYGKDRRWNIVWRFVAGLTRLKHLGPLINEFLTERSSTHFFFECLFEAQTTKYCNFTNTCIPKLHQVRSSKFDSYTLGYCIAKYLDKNLAPLCVTLHASPVKPFLTGLKIASSCSSVIEESGLVSLSFDGCDLFDADLIILSELIPRMQSLKTLALTSCNLSKPSDLLRVLQQLSHSNVTSLKLAGTDFGMSEDCYTALKKLISVPSGRLESLSFGRTEDCYLLMSLVSGPSSLNTLCIFQPESWISSLCSNTCITRLELSYEKRLYPLIPQLVEILNRNTTMLYLKLWFFNMSYDIDIEALRILTDALSENSTLQCMEVWVILPGSGARSQDPVRYASELMRKPDSRISWKVINPTISYTSFSLEDVMQLVLLRMLCTN